MLGVAAFPSLFYALCCLALPESPRWLLSRKGDRDAGLRMLQQIEPNASASEIAAEADQIIASSAPTAATGRFWAANFAGRSSAFLIVFFNQMSGLTRFDYPPYLRTHELAAKAALLPSVGIASPIWCLRLLASGLSIAWGAAHSCISVHSAT